MAGLQHPTDEWLRLLYQETWKQYIHEDSIAQTRGTIFTAIFAALLAFLGLLTISIIKLPCSLLFEHFTFAPGFIGLGLLWISASYIVSPLITAFKEVTAAGHRYVNVRGATLRILEATARVGPLGPATFEDAWRTLSDEKNPEKKVTVLPGDLQSVSTITGYNFRGGFHFLFQIIGVLRRASMFLRRAGWIITVTGLLFPFISCLKTVPLCQ